MGDSALPSGPDFSEGIALDDIEEGRPLSGRLGEAPVMLLRRGDSIVALGSQCTHYGADLTQGLVDGDTVRCPLHHACFSLRTGEALSAPAFDGLGRWVVEIRDGMAFVAGRDAEDRRPASSPAHIERILIVGGGAAGFACAERLRRLGFNGEIAIASADRDPPCDRPNLSKDFLAGTAPAEWIPLRAPDWYAEQEIRLELGTEIAAIDCEERTATAADGRTFAWDRLLLAPGSEPVRLAGSGFDSGEVRYLRSLADAEAIVERARPGARAVVVGSGFIGLEATAALRARGVAVAIVTAEALPFERQLGSELGAFYRRLHERNGVTFHCGRTAASFDGRVLNLDDGERLDTDFVLTGIGVRPKTSLARAAGLAVGDGILVNAKLETSEPGIFAAGDAAAFPDPLTGESVRVEHWVVAQRQGQLAAANMLGDAEPFRDVPFFWTEQYGVSLRYVGRGSGGDDIRIDGDVADGAFTVRYFSRGRLSASASIGRDLDNLEDERRLREAVLSRAGER